MIYLPRPAPSRLPSWPETQACPNLGHKLTVSFAHVSLFEPSANIGKRVFVFPFPYSCPGSCSRLICGVLSLLFILTRRPPACAQLCRHGGHNANSHPSPFAGLQLSAHAGTGEEVQGKPLFQFSGPAMIKVPKNVKPPMPLIHVPSTMLQI